VPARIKSFDACILPLREIEYSYRSSPIQVFDYLAAGKARGSSPVAQFEAWPSLVSIAELRASRRRSTSRSVSTGGETGTAPAVCAPAKLGRSRFDGTSRD
jgi:hypothetical protein